MDLPFPAEDLARLYRFALLMTGGETVAEEIVYQACQGCAARVGSYRNNANAFACLLENIRARAKSAPPGAGAAPPLARAFAALPEPERSALGMLYSGLLPAQEIAEVLKVSLEKMGELLKSARERLEQNGLGGEPEPAP